MPLQPSKADIYAFLRAVKGSQSPEQAFGVGECQEAKAALTEAYSVYESKDQFGVLFNVQGAWMVQGGFPTALQADRWATKAGLEPGKATIVPIRSVDE